MRRPILALAAAVFLSGGTLAYAQGTPPDSGQSQKDQTKDQMQQPGSSGDQTKMQQPGARSGAEPRTMPSSEQRPSDRNMQNTQMQGGQGSEREQMQGRDQPQGGQMLRGGEERGEGTRPLSVEQKTTLRDTVLRRGPKLTHVSFRIGVGAVVPRSVRVVAVPQPILAIYPEWAGDLYFVYGDEIVVVAPDSMAIVGVLPL